MAAIAAATLAPMAAAQASKSTPFVAIGVWYPATVDIDAMRQDFRDIQASGFNAVLTSISWKDGEPRRGAYNLLNLDRVIAIASEVGLRVHVDVLPEPDCSR
jgi:beta-galactosidase GanA